MLTSQLDVLLWFKCGYWREKNITEHRVVHDFGLCAMVRTAQDGDLYAHV